MFHGHVGVLKLCTNMATTYVWFMIRLLQKQKAMDLTLSLLRVINVKIPLQPHKKYDITQYGELDFS